MSAVRGVVYLSISSLLTGDRKLSYREFIAVMKGWKLRGNKVCVCVCVRVCVLA